MCDLYNKIMAGHALYHIAKVECRVHVVSLKKDDSETGVHDRQSGDGSFPHVLKHF